MSTEWLHRAGHSGESALLTSPYARLSSPAESPAKSGEHDKSMPLGTISHNAQQSSIDYAHNPESKTETIKSKLGSLLRRVSTKSPASTDSSNELDAPPLKRLTRTDSDTLDVPKPHLTVRNSIDIARAKLLALSLAKKKRQSSQSYMSTHSRTASDMTVMIYEAGGMEGRRARLVEQEEQEEQESGTTGGIKPHSVRFKELAKREPTLPVASATTTASVENTTARPVYRELPLLDA